MRGHAFSPVERSEVCSHGGREGDGEREGEGEGKGEGEMPNYFLYSLCRFCAEYYYTEVLSVEHSAGLVHAYV